MFGWSFEELNDGDAYVKNANKLSMLRAFYENTTYFIINEFDALSAAWLGQLHDTLCVMRHPSRNPNRPEKELPFGGMRMILLGDPAQLRPPIGAAIYDECANRESSHDPRTLKGKMQTAFRRTAKGHEFYKNI